MPQISFPTFDFSTVLEVLSSAIGAVAVPALPYLIGAAALTGVVTWIVRKGKGVVKLR